MKHYTFYCNHHMAGSPIFALDAEVMVPPFVGDCFAYRIEGESPDAAYNAWAERRSMAVRCIKAEQIKGAKPGVFVLTLKSEGFD
jgi:hypothetical protein